MRYVRIAIFLAGVLPPLISQAQEKLIYHDIVTDKDGHIIPWYDQDPGKSYDHIVKLVWNFWDTMRVDMNGLPYYMNHQVWRPDFNDPRGLGGDQLQMALSSWRLLYRYTGNERIKENMRFLCDYYLTHGLSPDTSKWPDIPFPYNTLIYSGFYDGDMVIGKGYAQPDKAGSFGIELIHLFKMMSSERYPHATERRYLDAATSIANTLADKIIEGDGDHSPWPFKVNVFTEEVGALRDNRGSNIGYSAYTTNWSGIAELFLALIELKHGKVAEYQKAFDTVLSWMKKYPMKSNKWGPFFEDIPGWSDTQINAMTWARFIMTHRNYFPEWKQDVQRIIDWVYQTLGNDSWKKYGVTVVNEQTAYLTPGNSHTSRQAADELLFASLTGESSRVPHAIRQLNWATYMVDIDGKNRYPRDENWLTDGYGDYVRHYLRAMEAWPALAPADGDHLIASTTVVQQASYNNLVNKWIVPDVRNIDPKLVILFYRTYDGAGVETLRLTRKPARVLLNDKELNENENASGEGYSWKTLDRGGVLTVRRKNGTKVVLVSGN
jgi:hypothetical protein